MVTGFRDAGGASENTDSQRGSLRTDGLGNQTKSDLEVIDRKVMYARGGM